ncbi:MAG: hypothetical protein JSV88_32715 [Candidatus Aminicenantes bacterium]|nr:MAG: hypothetical protein JSV88_32715 [Candidatus Aminicenantes bacterium]
MKGISRSEINRLMAIPEVQQIIAAKFVELRLIFKNKLKESAENQWEESETSNIIRFPIPFKNIPEKETSSSSSSIADDSVSTSTIIKIVDASGYRYAPEEEQVRIFMDYFKNHQALRKTVLDDFFLRILPYSNIMVK